MSPHPTKTEKPIHILMISLGESILHQETSDSLDRHRRYAQSVGRLSMIVYAPGFSTSPVRQVDSHLRIIPARAKSRFGFLVSAYKIGLELARDDKLDMITTQDPFATGLIGFLLKRRLRIPLEVQNHSDFFDNHYWISQRPIIFTVFNMLGKWIIRKTDSLRVVNHTEAEKYRRFKIHPDRIKLLPVPVDLEKFNKEVFPEALRELDRRLNVGAREKIVLWVGRAVWFKRVPVLLQAVELLSHERKDFRLLIVGDGTELPLWKKLATQFGLGNRAIFAGHIPHSDLPLYVARCQLLVHSSIYEGFGRIMVEAAASAKPVVATRTAGAREVVSDEVTGLVADVEDHHDLARKIALILDNPRQSKEMGRAGREKVLREFDPDKTFESIIATWREMVKKHAAVS